jgi:hypothetical protein
MKTEKLIVKIEFNRIPTKDEYAPYGIARNVLYNQQKRKRIKSKKLK